LKNLKALHKVQKFCLYFRKMSDTSGVDKTLSLEPTFVSLEPMVDSRPEDSDAEDPQTSTRVQKTMITGSEHTANTESTDLETPENIVKFDELKEKLYDESPVKDASKLQKNSTRVQLIDKSVNFSDYLQSHESDVSGVMTRSLGEELDTLPVDVDQTSVSINDTSKLGKFFMKILNNFIFD